MEYAISAIWTLLDTALVILFSGAFLTRRRKKYDKPVVIFAVIAIYVLMLCLESAYITKLLQMVITLFIYFTMIAYLYRGRLLTQVLIVVVALVFGTTLESVLVAGTSLLLGLRYTEFAERRLAYVTIVTADRLIAILAAWILYRLRAKGDLGKVQGKWLALTVIFPAASIVMLTVLFLDYRKDTDIGTGVFAFGLILSIANIALIYIIHSLEKSTRREREMELLRQRIDLQARSFEALEESYRQQRKSTHEFQRHTSAIYGLLERGEYDEALSYTRKLQNDRSIRNTSIVSKNPVIDVILNREYMLACEQGIEMQVRVNDLSSLPFEADDMAVLFSNLLDNAIEACQRCHGQKEIQCSILLEDTLYISVRNTSLPVEITDGKIDTSKPNGKEHGYGLPAIKYILNALKAEYTFEYDQGWFSFASEIPI